jgi:hypothetical protein
LYGAEKALKPTAFLFCLAAKSYGICEQRQLKLTVFCQPHSETFWNLATKSNSN